MVDSILVLIISYSMPGVGLYSDFYLSEKYMYHTYRDRAFITPDEKWQGDYYIDFSEGNLYRIDDLYTKRQCDIKPNGSLNIYANNSSWKMELLKNKYMSFDAITEKYTSEKTSGIHTVTYAHVPLFQKYADRIANIGISDIVNPNSSQYTLKVQYRDYQVIEDRNNPSNLIEEAMIIDEMTKIEERKVPTDFFDRFTSLPIVDKI